MYQLSWLAPNEVSIDTVLILTADDDLHADFVVARLHERQQSVTRLDPGAVVSSEGNYQFALGADRVSFRCATSTGEALLTDPGIQSVLLRRPSRPQAPAQVTPSSTDFFLGEALTVLEAIPSLVHAEAIWINHPKANAAAGVKLHQLALAQRVGLSVPPTLVTNIPDRAFAFYTKHTEGVVCKPLSSTPIEQDGSRFIFTHKLPSAMRFSDFADVVMGSSLLQVCVHKRSDVRVAVIGEKTFGCEILSQRDARSRTDWRSVPIGLEHRSIAVPDDVARNLCSLRSALGLMTMHCDFAIDTNPDSSRSC